MPYCLRIDWQVHQEYQIVYQWYIQRKYLNLNYKFRSDYYNEDLENELLKSYGVTNILLDDIYKLYFEYKEKLILNKKLPKYPSIFCTDMQKLKHYI